MHRAFGLGAAKWTAGVIYLCFVALISAKYLTSSERQNCNQLLQGGGRWLDPPAARKPTTWTKWQPNAGCLLHHYQPSDVEQCLGNRSIFFAGDSIARNPFVELAHMFGRGDIQRQPHGLAFDLELGSVKATFIPDDFLNRTKTLDRIAEANARPGSDSRHPGDLILVGAGLWYRREFRANWMEVMQQYMDPILRSKSDHPPSDRAAWIVNTVPIPKAGTPDKARAGWFTDKEAATAEMNQYLQDAVGDHSRGKVATSFSTMNLDEGAMRDTVHTIDQLAAARMNLLLNYHCNAAILDPTESAGTCCTTARPSLSQTWYRVILLAVVIWRLRRLSPMKKAWDLVETHEASSTATTWTTIGMIVFPAVVCFAADETSLFGRHLRHASPSAPMISLLMLALVAALTIRRHQASATHCDSYSFHDTALTTCKGWIATVLILIELFEVQSVWENAEHVDHACLLAFIFILGYNAASFIARRFPDNTSDMRRIFSELANPVITIYLTYLALAPRTAPALIALIAFWPALASVLLTPKLLPTDRNSKSFPNKFLFTTACKVATTTLILIGIAAFIKQRSNEDLPASFTRTAFYSITAIPAFDAGTFYAWIRTSNPNNTSASPTSPNPPTTPLTTLLNTFTSILLLALLTLILHLTPPPPTTGLGTSTLIAFTAASLLLSSFIFFSKTGYASLVTAWMGEHAIELLLLHKSLLLGKEGGAVVYSGVVNWVARGLGLRGVVGVHPDVVMGVEVVFDVATLGLCAWGLRGVRDVVFGVMERERDEGGETGGLPRPL